jgi:hypothetical protein
VLTLDTKKRPREREAFFVLQYSAPGMTTVTADLYDVLIIGILAMIAAVLLVAAY